MSNKSRIKRLQHQMDTFVAEPMAVEPWITEPIVVPVRSQIPQPPPGGWPDDYGWETEAAVMQGMSGEDPQC